MQVSYNLNLNLLGGVDTKFACHIVNTVFTPTQYLQNLLYDTNLTVWISEDKSM